MTYVVDNTSYVADEIFELLLWRFKSGLETLVRGSNSNFSSVQLLCYKYYKMIFKRGRSYIESPDWIKITLNLKNRDDKCFHLQ